MNKGLLQDKCVARQRGIALVLVLWLVLALAGIASGFIYYVRLEARAVNNQKLKASALALAEAGIVHAAFLLKNDTTIIDSPNDEWAKPVDQQLGEGTYSVTIVDEERKVNINYASETIMIKIGIRQDMAREIIEYRKNKGMLDTITEIRMINRMDDDSYRLINDNFTTMGEININMADSAVLVGLMTGLGIEATKADRLADEIVDRQPFTNVDKISEIVGDEIYQILKPIVTTVGGININTTSESVLLAYEVDSGIIQSRPVETISNKSFTVSSKYFSVTATGNNKGICKTIHAIYKRTKKDEKWEIENVYWLEDEC
ncbi:general secretion pathway protein GspK [bacterium]|nr:general secretion pathway protein GspK [bacterium]MBU1754222.1 general secretion pathway protein GspK [bacterium]